MQEQKDSLRSELDRAVDAMDLAEIERLTAALEQMQPPIAAEEPLLFAARVKKLDKERKEPMNTKQTARTIFVAAAAVAVLSVGVFAAGNALKNFSFVKDGVYYTVTTTEQDVDEDIVLDMKLADDKTDGPVPADPNVEAAQPNAMELEINDYESLEQAEEALGIKAVKPGKLPGLPLSSVSGQATQYANYLWADYGEGDKLFGITVVWDKPQAGSITSISEHEIEPGSEGSYKTAKGDKFTTLREDGAEIATIRVGEYEYTLVFAGFSQAERQEILDSVDLSPYR